MKNIIKSFAALAAVLVSFASCQKEIKVAEEKTTEVGHYVEFTTPAPDAKTSFEIVGSAVNYSWSETDQTDPLGERPEKFIVWENETAATSINAVLTAGQMHITAGFPGEEPYSAEYRAIFNPGVSSDQTCTGTTYDQGSDFLVSNVLYSGKNDLVFRFKRETGLAKIQLEGLAIGSQLLSVKIATDTTITGTYNIETGEFDDGKQAITIATANAITTGEAQVYFSTVPFKNKNAKVIVETSNDGSSVAAKYVKVFSKPLSIVKGDVTAFSVDLTDCDVLWYESFDKCAGLGGNDGKWSGSGIGSATISTDNADWDFINGGGASACMKLGSSKNAGVATTPALGFTGNAVIKFRAGSWGSDATTINLSTTGGGTLSSSSVTPSTNAFGEYSVDLNGATAATQIIFEGTGGNCRFFLDEIRIYEGTPGPSGSHNVSCASVSGGTLSASPTSASQGNEITLTATPDAGYTFNDDWSAVDSDSNPVAVTAGKFTMPDKDVNVSGSFSKIQYAISKTAVAHGSFTVKVGGSVVSTAGTCDTVALAYTPADGYNLESWSVVRDDTSAEVTVKNNSFIMPAAAVTVTANISKNITVPITLADGIYSGSAATGKIVWDNTYCTITQTKNTSSTNVNSTYVSSPRWYAGHMISFAAKGDYQITKCVIVCAGSYVDGLANATYSTGASASKDGSTVTINCSGNFTAVISGGQARPTSITVYVTPLDEGTHKVTCSAVSGGALSASPTSAAQGTEITLTATPDEGYYFNNDWSAVDSDSNPVAVTAGKFTMPDKNVTVSGSFSKIPYAITKADVAHGSFTTTCSGAEVSTAGKGDIIELAYTPADGYILESWSVEETISGTAVTVYSTNKFTMPAAAVTVTANIKSGSSVPTYASLAELVAAGAPTTTAKKVNVTLTNDEITKLYKSSGNTKGIYFMAGGQEIEIYCSTAAPSTWEVGGTISGTLNNCDWKLYSSTWELCPADWSELSYTAPLPKCATPVITLTGASAAINCETEGVTIRYTVGTSPADPTSTSGTVYTGAVTLIDGQTIKAIAYKDGYRNSDVASEEYVAGAAKTWTYAVSDTSPVFNDSAPITINSASWSISMGEKVGAPDVNGSINSYNKVKGWKWGNSGSKYWKSYTLSTDYFTSKKIKSVTVNFLNNGSKSGTMLVKQGTTTIGSDTKTFGTTWTDLTASGTNGTSGTLTIQYTVAQASYIHSITVEYYD